MFFFWVLRYRSYSCSLARVVRVDSVDRLFFSATFFGLLLVHFVFALLWLDVLVYLPCKCLFFLCVFLFVSFAGFFLIMSLVCRSVRLVDFAGVFVCFWVPWSFF